jgi:hypothetical protein
MKENIPIACSLNGAELAARRSGLLEKTGQQLVKIEERGNGFVYLFPVDDAVFENLFEVIRLERKCCPFLDFKLILEAQSEFISLELSGQIGAKEAIRNLFQWN